jgi:hypothetical protein
MHIAYGVCKSMQGGGGGGPKVYGMLQAASTWSRSMVMMASDKPMFLGICIYVLVCVYAHCVYAFMRGAYFPYLFVLGLCMFGRMCVCIYICMYIYGRYAWLGSRIRLLCVCMCVYIYVCMYIWKTCMDWEQN